MKIAVVGKGGVGKTFIAGTIARSLAAKGRTVVAIDADPAMNLAYSLGIPYSEARLIVPLSENLDLVEERTGARPGTTGSVFNLTPKVYDIVEKYGTPGPDGVRLLVLGTVKAAGAGCMCPANALLRALLRHHLVRRDEDLVVDTEAGLEHFGRGVVKGFDVLLDIVEPRGQSIQTGLRAAALARELQVKRTLFIGNKVKDEAEEKFLRDALSAEAVSPFSIVPYDPQLEQADMARVAPIDYAPSCKAVAKVRELAELLEKGQTSR
ncbi:MAG: ArsA-related P-loop ATPase [Candidatus Bathyarchaeia archaeon]